MLILLGCCGLLTTWWDFQWKGDDRCFYGFMFWNRLPWLQDSDSYGWSVVEFVSCPPADQGHQALLLLGVPTAHFLEHCDRAFLLGSSIWCGFHLGWLLYGDLSNFVFGDQLNAKSLPTDLCCTALWMDTTGEALLSLVHRCCQLCGRLFWQLLGAWVGSEILRPCTQHLPG